MNTDNFLIDNSDIEMAQNICKMITNTEVRNRAVANAIAGSIAAKFFDTEKYDVDSESGLHNIGTVLEDIDISDIYINGNYFDARVFFNEEEMSIPAAHFKNNLLPTAYMFIKINADLSGATVIGFVNPENVKMMNSVDGYYHINEDDLESFYDIEPLIVTVEDSVEVSDKDIFAFIDNSLEDKNSFYAELLKSKEGRIKLAKAIKAQNIFKFVSIADNNNIEANEIEENIPDFGFGDSPEISFESSGDLDLLSEENIDDLSLENPIVDDLEPSIDTLDSIEETSDLIDLEELTQVDSSYLETLIASGKDKVYEDKISEFKKRLDAENLVKINELNNKISSLEKQHESELKINAQNIEKEYLNKIAELNNIILTLKKENESALVIKEQEVAKTYENNIAGLKQEIEILKSTKKSDLENLASKNEAELSKYKDEANSKYADLEQKYKVLMAQHENQVKQVKLEVESDFNNKIAEMRSKQEVEKIKFENEVANLKASFENEKLKVLAEQKEKYDEEIRAKEDIINHLQRTKAAMNVKQTGEDLEAWCDSEIRSYMQNGLFNCTWDKDNTVVKEEGESKGSKLILFLRYMQMISIILKRF